MEDTSHIYLSVREGEPGIHANTRSVFRSVGIVDRMYQVIMKGLWYDIIGDQRKLGAPVSTNISVFLIA